MVEAEPYIGNKHISNKALAIKQVSTIIGMCRIERQAHVPDVFHQTPHSTTTLKVHNWGDLGVDGWILGWISRQEVGCGYMDWIGLAQDRDGWRRLVSAVINLRVP